MATLGELLLLQKYRALWITEAKAALARNARFLMIPR